MASGVLTFRSAYNSGIILSQLGEGQFDHLGFFSAGGVNDAIIVGQYNQSTFIVDASGVPNSSVWGELMNSRYLDASGVSISGSARIGINDAALQSPAGTASGTLRIRFVASGALTVSTYNAKIYCYDNTADIYTAPTDITAYGYEISPSGNGIGGWHSLQGFAQGVNFVDHSPQTNYAFNSKEHDWWVGLSARAESVGILDSWDVVFSFQFA